jgi:hypothetical protein
MWGVALLKFEAIHGVDMRADLFRQRAQPFAQDLQSLARGKTAFEGVRYPPVPNETVFEPLTGVGRAI